DWDGTVAGIGGATWVPVDGIGSVTITEGSPDAPPYRLATVREDGPVVDVITLIGWHNTDDQGQALLREARQTLAPIGVRIRADGTSDTGECWLAKVGPRDHRSSAEGGLQTTTFTLYAVEHGVIEDYS